MGHIWIQAEAKELGNHSNNHSWSLIKRSEVPRGRKLHKLIWVYKLKRLALCTCVATCVDSAAKLQVNLREELLRKELAILQSRVAQLEAQAPE